MKNYQISLFHVFIVGTICQCSMEMTTILLDMECLLIIMRIAKEFKKILKIRDKNSNMIVTLHLKKIYKIMLTLFKKKLLNF